MTSGNRKHLDWNLVFTSALRLLFAPSRLLILPLFLVFTPLPGPLYAGTGANPDTPNAGSSAGQVRLAEQALLFGNLDEALARTRQILAANPGDGEADLLMCRSLYAEEQANAAIHACEAAVRLMPRSSAAEDWLGRAYGMAAKAAGPISGLSLALKVKAAFAAAVQLDPEDGPAVNDLSEFYIDAPAFLGGGLDKATALAERVQSSLPQQADRIRALAAEKQKDYATAQNAFQAAAAVANQPAAWVDLGAFYRRRGQYDKAVETLNQTLALDHKRDASLVDVASLLGRMHREPEVVWSALQDYLLGGDRSDAAPAVKVYVMLGEILASRGDRTGAKIEFEKALSMARGYAPAQRALQQL